MSTPPSDFLHALARDSFAAAVLVLLVLATQRIFRKQLSPHWQCTLWLLVVARLLPVSFASDTSIFNLLPRWGAGPAATASTAPLTGDRSAPWWAAITTAMNAGVARNPDSASGPGVGDATEEPASRFFINGTWPAVIFFGWLAGVVGLSSYVAVVSLSLARSLARLKPLDDPAVLEVLHDCCTLMGIRRAPVLAESRAVNTPALHGLLRPRLLLPVGFSTIYSPGEQRFVFLHELAHLRRRDLLLNWLMTGLQIVHWFNPLIWFGFARWRVDREIACDAAALEVAGAEHNRAYGRTMLRLLQQFSAPHRRPGLVGILEDKRQLQRRLKRIATFAPADGRSLPRGCSRSWRSWDSPMRKRLPR